jgi:glutaredoxin
VRRLRLYARAGCHLCDEARELLVPLVREARDVELEEVDIDVDDELLKAYLERIPVIELDGEVIGELIPEPPVLRAALLHTSAR